MYRAHRAVIFAVAQLSSSGIILFRELRKWSVVTLFTNKKFDREKGKFLEVHVVGSVCCIVWLAYGVYQ